MSLKDSVVRNAKFHIKMRRSSCRRGGIAMIALLLTSVIGSPTASAFAPDRKAPTKPGNFRVTAKTPFSVSLAWNSSSDNSGSFTYRLWSTAGPTVTLPQSATSYVWNTGIYPRNSYTFGIYAVDAAGNNSPQASLSTTVPADTTPPSTAPVVTVTEVSSTYISISWTAAQDDGPYLFYQVWLNGSAHAGAGTSRAISLNFLQPSTTYTIQVRAYDYGPNWGPLSAPVNVTTTANNPNDTTPPTTPANLTDNGMFFGEELWLFWDDSTDNVTPSANIRYDVYLNGALDHSIAGYSQTIMYITPGVLNTVQVVAVDAAGNVSAPATAIYDLR